MELTLRLEELHALWRRNVLLDEHFSHGALGDVGRRVEEVQDLRIQPTISHVIHRQHWEGTVNTK